MILTCADWNNWSTDTGGSGVVDWADLQGKPPLPYFEMLRLAAAERCEVTDTTTPALLADSITPGVDTQRPARMGALHELITSLIPEFVNHTDHSGDWTGQTTCAPAWTEESILADIGDAGRVAMVGSAAWVKQCYEILNRLVWVKITYDYWSKYWASNPKAYRGFSSISWEDCKADFLASGIKNPYTSPCGFAAHAAFRNRYGWVLDRVFCENQEIVVEENSGFMRAYDMYCEAADAGSTFNDSPQYLNNDFGKYAIVASNSLPNLDTTTLATYGKNKNITVTEPPAPESFSDASNVGYGTAWLNHTVYKFNVPGGFKFQAAT